MPPVALLPRLSLASRPLKLLCAGAAGAILLGVPVLAQQGARQPVSLLPENVTLSASTMQSSTLKAPTTLVTGTGGVRDLIWSNAVTSAPKPQANTYSTTTVGTTNGTQFVFTTSFSSSTTVTGSGVYTLGDSGSDFKDTGAGSCDTNGYPYTYASGSSCTSIVTFTPSRPGNRQGAEVVYTSTAGSYYFGTVNGIGTGPEVTFATSTPALSTIASGLSAYNSAVDGAGNLWVTDSVAGSVKEFVLTNGSYPSSPSNTFTGFTTPQGIAIDGIGDVFVGDSGKSYIWRLPATNGTVPPGTAPVPYVTFFSASTQPSFVAMDPTFTTLYMTGVYSGSNYLVYCTLSAGTCNLVTNFNAPSGLAIDSAGYKYILDSTDKAVYRLAAAASSTTKTTVVSGLTLPYGISADAAGDLYVADRKAGTSGTGTILEYLATSGLVSTSSTSRTVATGLYAPSGVTVDSSGNLFIADTSNSALKYIDLTDAPDLTFSQTAVGSTSASQSVTLQNIGNANLTFPAPSTGSNPGVPSGFTLTASTTCPIVAAGSSAGTLAQGSTCAYVPAFSPTSSGSVINNLLITDNNLAVTSTQSIKMTGYTGGLTLEVVGETAAKGSTAVPLEVIMGYGGTTPSVKPTVTVNGSSTGVGMVTCVNKSLHQNCTLTYNASSLAPGNYTISATEAANGPYSSTSATGILSIIGSSVRAPSPITAMPSMQSGVSDRLQ